jgi:hypothetical protein
MIREKKKSKKGEKEKGKHKDTLSLGLVLGGISEECHQSPGHCPETKSWGSVWFCSVA